MPRGSLPSGFRVQGRDAAGASREGLFTREEEDPTPALDLVLDTRAAIARLPARQRRIVTSIFLEGRTQEETAEALNVSQATVSQQLSAAKRALKKMLGAAYAD